jgi:MoaA/NifB/PqqE/SkfB family radical SAM enzyme
MNAARFCSKLIQLHCGKKREQLSLDRANHGAAYRGTKLPLQVTFSCTYRCNLKCAHCQAENSNVKDEISTKRFLEIIDEIAEAGAVRIGFTGGEPLIRKDMTEGLRHCYEHKILTTMVSNSYLVPQSIEHLKKLSLLFLSLDGTREAHEQIRGKGSFDQFLKAVRAAKDNGIPVAALTTLCSVNYPAIQEMCDLIKALDIHWLVGVIQTRFTGRTSQDLTQERLNEMLDKIEKVKNLRTAKAYLDLLRGKRQAPECFAGVGYAIIAPDGCLYPCFPAQFDKSYKGVSVLDKSFKQAFAELPLYRATCDTCTLACHIEANFLYQFEWASILQAIKLKRRKP